MPEDSNDTVVIRGPLNKLQQARFSKSKGNSSIERIDPILSELMAAVDEARKAHFKSAHSKDAALANLYPTSSV